MPISPLNVDLLVEQTFIAQVEHHASLGSTNDRAKVCAAGASSPLPLLIVADEQTSGRGRGSNRWWTGQDGLACSLLLDVGDLGVDRSRSPLVALGAAVAIAETVAPLLPSHTVGVHWPNDVVADGRKLAGILVEFLANRRLVVGIGLNTNNSLRQAPKELRRTATTLYELTGTRHDRTAILLALLGHLDALLGHLASSPEKIAARANGLCLQRGWTLTVQLGREVICGRCAGIASDGALLLDTDRGREKLYSGVLR